MLNRIPVKLSPHQIGIQEMLLLSEMRGGSPDRITLIGVIPESLDASDQLSPTLQARLDDVAGMILKDLAADGVAVLPMAA